MSECTCHPVPFEDCITYGSAVEPGSAFEPNPDCPEHFPGGLYRWKVACINWGHPTALKAIAYRLWNGWLSECEQYFPTHAEAIAYADRAARTTKNGDNK